MYALLKALILPPASLLIAAVVGYFFWNSSTLGRRFVAVSLALLYLVSTPLAGDILLSSIERFPPLPVEGPIPHEAQAIVILSADSVITPEYPSPSPGALTLERLRYGALLQRKSGLPILVTGGIPPERSYSMASMMRTSLADDFNVPVTWVEDESQDTHQNAVRSVKILKEQGIDNILLVTHSWHMQRAKLAFERAGIVVIPAPTVFVRNTLFASVGIWDVLPSAKGFQNSYFAFHEVLGYSVYWLIFAS